MRVQKILIFAHDSSLYGSTQSLLPILKQLSQTNNYKCLLIIPFPGPLEGILINLNISYKIIKFPLCGYRSISSPISDANINYKKQIAKQLAKSLYNLEKSVINFKPSLIYSNTSTVTVGYILASKYHIPHVWHIREYGKLDYDLIYLPSLDEVVKYMCKSSCLIFNSESVMKYWIENKKANSIVVYNGIFNSKINLIRKKQPIGSFTFGILGALIESKGIHVALEAFLKLVDTNPDIYIKIYGHKFDVEYHKYLMTILNKYINANNKVFFCEFESNQDALYAQLDAVLCCSKNEAFGRTIVEAMSRGIPVISNNVGGPTEIINHEVNGLLYNNSVEDLSKCMSRLITDKILYENLSENGFKHAQINFSEKKYVSSVIEIINNNLKLKFPFNLYKHQLKYLLKRIYNKMFN